MPALVRSKQLISPQGQKYRYYTVLFTDPDTKGPITTRLNKNGFKAYYRPHLRELKTATGLWFAVWKIPASLTLDKIFRDVYTAAATGDSTKRQRARQRRFHDWLEAKEHGRTPPKTAPLHRVKHKLK